MTSMFSGLWKLPFIFSNARNLGLSVRKDFRLSMDDAKAIIKEVSTKVATLGLGKAEIDQNGLGV